MNPTLILTVICIYFSVLMLIAYFTSRKADSQSFYLGNRKSPWYIIAIAMVGTSISGVTFVSVPGMVIGNGFTYMQMVFGFLLGYVAVANILLPIYYKLNLTTIYTYLEQRFGGTSYETGAWIFLVSRILGSAFRLYIVAVVLQKAVFDAWEIPFFVTVVVTIFFIFIYTQKGGMKTVIWTDTIQTLVLVSTVLLCIWKISSELNFSIGDVAQNIQQSDFSQIFIWDIKSPHYFWKQFLAGVFTVIAMTGLDQDQMQKNLSCRSLKDAKKNMYTYGFLFIPINLIFLSLGVLLVIFSQQVGIDYTSMKGDELFPMLATHSNPATGRLYMGTLISVLFIVGIISAAYSSADSALTALTTSFTVDILKVKNDDPNLVRKRRIVHISLSIVCALVIMLFRVINDESVISAIYRIAGYTYGPLLGLFAFGLLTKYSIKDKWVPFVCVLSPILTYGFSKISPYLFNGYECGFELLIINGAFCFLGLYCLKTSKK